MRIAPPAVASLGVDGGTLLAARALRLFASGFVSIVLPLYLAALGLGPVAIGAIFTCALAGSALTTVVVAAVADRYGRRRMLLAMGGLIAIAGAAFAVIDEPWLLAVAAFVGAISPGGGEIGTSLALEQAALAEVLPPARRTDVFAWANVVASAATAVGALAGGAPTLAQRAGMAPLEADRLILWAYAVAGLALIGIFARLSPAVEPVRTLTRVPSRRLGLHRSQGIVARLALLFGLNSFAAGFVVQSFLAYWFHRQFATDAATLGVIFFLTNAVGALSYPVAARLARRIGLVNTMVFTHLPSNLLLILVPFMPTLLLAAAVLVLRHAVSQMDRPVRESYTMAIVASDERTAAAGLLTVTADAAASVATVVAGTLMVIAAPALPFVIAGTLRCVYDGVLFATFRNVRPPQ